MARPFFLFIMPFNRYDYSGFVATDNNKPKGGFTPYNSSPDNLKNDFEHDFGSNFTELFDWDGYDAINQLAYPGAQQEKEWLQQLFMQWYQNQWNSASAQMARAKAAGINLNIAAQGVVGSSPSAGSSPNSAVGSGEGAVDAAVGLANGAMQGFGSVAQGIDQLSTLELRKGLYRMDTSKKFVEMGFTQRKSDAMAIEMETLSEKNRLGIAKLMADLDIACLSYDKMNKDIAKIDEEIKYIDEQIETAKNMRNLADQQAYQAQKQGILAEKQAVAQEWRNGFMEKYNVDPNLPIVNNIMTSNLSGSLGSDGQPISDKLANITYNYNYNFYKGQYEAQARFGPVLNKFHAAQVFVDTLTSENVAPPEVKEKLETEFRKYTEESAGNHKSYTEARLWWSNYATVLNERFMSGDESVKEALDEALYMMSAPMSVYRERYGLNFENAPK